MHLTSKGVTSLGAPNREALMPPVARLSATTGVK